MKSADEFVTRRQKQALEQPTALGANLNQGGSKARTSAQTLPDIMGQGPDDKHRDPGTEKLRRYINQ